MGSFLIREAHQAGHATARFLEGFLEGISNNKCFLEGFLEGA